MTSAIIIQEIKQAAQALCRHLETFCRPGWYRHYQGYLCQVLTLAVRQKDFRVVVVYRYPDTQNVWEHEVEDFLGTTPQGSPRFVYLGDSPDAAVSS
jgi:hypothetical protein